MQDTSLLEQVDWFFTSVAWTNQYPLTVVLPLARITSTTFPTKSKLTQVSQRQIFLGLKIIGLVILAALIRFVAGNF